MRTEARAGMILAAVSLAALSAGCGQSQFQGGTKANQKTEDVLNPSEGQKSGEQNPQTTANPTTVGENSNPALGDNPIAGTPPTPAQTDPCSGDFRGGPVLILDLKSGWFAGDGGSFFQDKINPNCPGKPALNLHYFHVTKAIIEGNRDLDLLQSNAQSGIPAAFREALACSAPFSSDNSGRMLNDESPQDVCLINSLDQYSQVWLLSGDRADDLDVDLNSPFFASVLEQIQIRSQRGPFGIFLGAGLSNVSHSNALAQRVLGADAFSRNIQSSQGVFPSIDYTYQFLPSPLTPSSGATVTAGTFLDKFNALAGLGSLFDYGDLSAAGTIAALSAPFRGNANYIFASVPRCFADPISNPSIQVVARDRCNNAVNGYIDQPKLRVFAEGNMARFYGMTNPQAHIARIARFLSLSNN